MSAVQLHSLCIHGASCFLLASVLGVYRPESVHQSIINKYPTCTMYSTHQSSNVFSGAQTGNREMKWVGRWIRGAFVWADYTVAKGHLNGVENS